MWWVNRVPELRSWTIDPLRRNVAHRCRRHLRRAGRTALGRLVPALAQAARTVGSPQIRNAATIGGNVVTCSPAGDGLPVLGAVEAMVELVEGDGVRELPIGVVMVGVKQTALRPGELVTGDHRAVARRLAGLRQGRRAQCDGHRHRRGVPSGRRAVPVGAPRPRRRWPRRSCGPRQPRRTSPAVDWSEGTIAADAVAEFGRLAATASAPIDDHRSTADYRRHSIDVLARRLLRRAFTVATGAGMSERVFERANQRHGSSTAARQRGRS